MFKKIRLKLLWWWYVENPLIRLNKDLHDMVIEILLDNYTLNEEKEKYSFEILHSVFNLRESDFEYVDLGSEIIYDGNSSIDIVANMMHNGVISYYEVLKSIKVDQILDICNNLYDANYENKLIEIYEAEDNVFFSLKDEIKLRFLKDSDKFFKTLNSLK